MKMQTDQACGKCQHWDRFGETQSGQCRRYPPGAVVTLDITQEPALDAETGVVFNRPKIVNNVKFMFPHMAEDNRGCGEYQENTDAH